MEMKNEDVVKMYEQAVEQQQQTLPPNPAAQYDETVMHLPMDMSNHHQLAMRNMSIMMEPSVPHHHLLQQPTTPQQQQQHLLQQQPQQHIAMHHHNPEHLAHLTTQPDPIRHDLSGLSLQSELSSMHYSTHKLDQLSVEPTNLFQNEEQCLNEDGTIVSLIENKNDAQDHSPGAGSLNNNLLSNGSNDGDNDDGHRPLKKRRMSRRRIAKPTNNSGSIYASTSCASEAQTAGPSSSTGQGLVTRSVSKMTNAKQTNAQLRRHQLILSKLVNVLSQLVSQISDKFYFLLTGKAVNIQIERMAESIQAALGQMEVAGKEEFIDQLNVLTKQYQMLLDERTQSEHKFPPDYLYASSDDYEHEFGETDYGLGEEDDLEDDEDDDWDNDDAGYKVKASKSKTKPAGSKRKTSATSNANATKRKKSKRKLANSAASKAGSVRDKNKMLVCEWPNCTYETKREWALNEHVNITHTGQKQFACKVEQCEKAFYTSAELDLHMKRSHSDVASKEFMSCTWPGCNALFKSKLGLRGHLRIHKGENMIACEWPGCSYLAKNKRQSENHLRKHTGDRPFRCGFNDCEASFRTNDSLRHHRKCHSEYRPFWCDWPGCDANFKTNRGLHLHRVLHTGEKIWRCTFGDCDFASERKYHVDVHIYENHTHTKPFQCNWNGCEASFLRNDKLQNHLKIHRQEKPYKCIDPNCDKHFVEKGNMMKHFNNVHKRT